MMKPFESMTEATDYTIKLGIDQHPVNGPKSVLVRFKTGIRRVTFSVGMVYYGDFQEVQVQAWNSQQAAAIQAQIEAFRECEVENRAYWRTAKRSNPNRQTFLDRAEAAKGSRLVEKLLAGVSPTAR